MTTIYKYLHKLSSWLTNICIKHLSGVSDNSPIFLNVQFGALVKGIRAIVVMAFKSQSQSFKFKCIHKVKVRQI